MKAERWKRLQDLFESVERLPKEERSAFLRSNCPDDPELRAELESILEHYTEDLKLTR